jgi:hypothetical protein
MRNLLQAARRAVFFLAVAFVATTAIVHPTPASAARVGSSWVEGTLVHISDNNIKVQDDRDGKVLSFLLVPHFDQVFTANGKGTYQMKALHSGSLVKVYYDQKLFGVRHADRILVLTRLEHAYKMQKG